MGWNENTLRRYDPCVGNCAGISRNDEEGELMFYDDHVEALAADRARIAAAIRWEHKLRPHFPSEPAEVVLERLLRVVEGG